MKLKSLLLTLPLLIGLPTFSGMEEGDKAWHANDYQTAYNEWKPFADNGNAEAIGNMGLLYENGYIVNKHIGQALEMYLIAANAGFQDAQINVARLYYHIENYNAAIKWTLAGLEQEYTSPELRLKDIKLLREQMLMTVYKNNQVNQDELDKAISYLVKSSATGDVDSQFTLADYYSAKRNDKESFKWMYKAALQGHLIAQNNVGTAYGYGQGVEKDLEKLLHWKTLAAKGDHEIAQSDLVGMYAKGYGTNKNLELAKYWAEIVRENNEHAYLGKVNDLWKEYELWKY